MRLSEVKDPVAFFCPEFAIDNDLPTYAGGLGILAADLINVAGNKHFPMVGIGLLYKGKFFNQHITAEGYEETRDSEFDHDTSFLRHTEIDGKPVKLTLPIHEGEVFFKSYHLRISDTGILFFLSTNVDGNPPEWINDMDALYRGDVNSQIRQQLLLGVGGMKLLETLKIRPSFCHINEGRPGFIIWELTAKLMREEELTFEKAWEKAKEKIIYTNHTLVAAGNPAYPAETVRWWAEPYAKQLKVDKELLVKAGIEGESFSITKFALNISAKQSAVSQIHGEYCKKQYPDYNWKAITNGVHMHRWQDSDFRDPKITDSEIWNLHLIKKRELMETVIRRTGFGYDPNRLVITWARRLAEYKQPKAIFKDIERLKNIVSNPQKPVQILYAGNTHSEDPNAKSLIEETIKIFSEELAGYAIFVPNYNISLANHLTSGSDIWLNTPKGNLEACGTSGMKAISNGVLNCTVLDGWTYEVDWKGIGWVLDPDNVSESFYEILDKEIIPAYYDRNEAGLPYEWIKRMRSSIQTAELFSAERMLDEYKEELYK